MEETYNIQAIVLGRQYFRESDSKITVYSLEKGRLELVARGTKKISSKLAGHLEPKGFVKIMVVRGKRFDYVGGVVSENSFQKIKNDLDKIKSAGEAINIFLKLIKEEEKNLDIYNLIKSFFEILNKKDFSNNDFLVSSFLLKLSVYLGYSPELFNCVICKEKIQPNGNRFSISKGGMVCKNCQAKDSLTISDNSIKIIRFIINNNLDKIIKIKTIKQQISEIKNIVDLFVGFQT